MKRIAVGVLGLLLSGSAAYADDLCTSDAIKNLLAADMLFGNNSNKSPQDSMETEVQKFLQVKLENKREDGIGFVCSSDVSVTGVNFPATKIDYKIGQKFDVKGNLNIYVEILPVNPTKKDENYITKIKEMATVLVSAIVKDQDKH